MKIKKAWKGMTLALVLFLSVFIFMAYPYISCLIRPAFGKVIDAHNGVSVFYNGNNPGTDLRNLTADGYNLGQKYQCVEFVKRYYYVHLKHKMPETYGHAKSFILPGLKEGARNKQRQLIQYTNGAKTLPKADDILILGPSRFNAYGHVAIITQCNNKKLEIIQQNVGCKTRDSYRIIQKDGAYWVDNERVLGWLRKE